MLKGIYYTLVSVLSLVGILTILLITLFVKTINSVKETDSAVSLPEEMVLSIDFSKNIPEQHINEFNLSTFKNPMSYPPMIDFISAIERAKSDDNIKGIYASLENNALGMAQVEEVRKAIIDFKSSGKKTIVYIPSLGFGLKDYYLATSFDEIWMPPNGMLPIVGISANFPFFKKLLEKIGINPVSFAKHEYKSMMTSFTDKNMPEKVKENMEKMLGGMYEFIVSEIAKDRDIAKNDMKILINKAPLMAMVAKEEGLIDKALYRSDAINQVNKEFGKKAELVDIFYYIASKNKTFKAKDNIVYLSLSGEIVNGEVMDSFSSSIGERNVFAILEEIYKIENLKALVIRIDSPGGSYDAADNIRYEISALKLEKKIPVIASFGNVSASGGYFIATAADKILADNTTITGSIGAISARIDASEMLNKIGVGFETITYGSNANMFNPLTTVSSEERNILDNLTEAVYQDFTAKVRIARNISDKDIDKVARGRVFSGIDAVKVGLVDELGGLKDAISVAKSLSKSKDANILIFPRQKTPLDALMDMFTDKSLSNFLGMEKFFGNYLQNMFNNKIMMKEEYISVN